MERFQWVLVLAVVLGIGIVLGMTIEDSSVRPNAHKGTPPQIREFRVRDGRCTVVLHTLGVDLAFEQRQWASATNGQEETCYVDALRYQLNPTIASLGGHTEVRRFWVQGGHCHLSVERRTSDHLGELGFENHVWPVSSPYGVCYTDEILEAASSLVVSLPSQ